MTKTKKESFFWISYSDLMTSLFFVMLVLFVLVIVVLHTKIVTAVTEREQADHLREETEQLLSTIIELENKRKLTQEELSAAVEEIRTTRERLNKILEIEESVRHIDPNLFEFDENFRRHTLRGIQVTFNTGSANINDIPRAERDRLLRAGRSIKSFVDEAVRNNPGVRYLLIVEGQASFDTYHRNFELSYERALALARFWRANGVDFFRDKNVEIIISGSGIESQFRIQPDTWGNRANQRFVIHIIPKIGNIEGIIDR